MFVRIRPTWPRGVVPTGQNLRDIDENTKNAWDGHGGGNCTPSSAVSIAGAGMIATTKWSLTNNAKVSVAGTPTSKILFGKKTSDDVFRYQAGHASRSRSLLRGIDEAHGSFSASLASFSTAFLGMTTTIPGIRFFAPLRIFDQSTLDSVTFRWRVGVAHSNVPQYLPQFRVLRVNASNGALAPLRGEDGTTDRDGFVVWGPRPFTGTTYFDSGNVKTLLYTCNQNNVIDRSVYFYFAEIIDESGTNAFSGASGTGNIFFSTLSAHSNINSLALRQ